MVGSHDSCSDVKSLLIGFKCNDVINNTRSKNYLPAMFIHGQTYSLEIINKHVYGHVVTKHLILCTVQ